MMVVLGASEDQLPVYLEAGRRGIHTVAVDQSRDRPALAHAGEWLPVSTRDHEAIVAALDGRRPGAVVTAATDAALWSWHELSHRYGVPYRYPAAAARASADKTAFHQVARAAGVEGYRWHRHTEATALTRAAADIGYPLVVKPPDNSGSKGVSLVERAADLPAAFAYARRFSTDGSLVVEEFLTGRNLTVDVFMVGGRAAFAGITEKRVVPGPHFVIGGHNGPATVDPATRTRLVSTAERLCRAIDLIDGPANFDVILRADGSAAVLEVNARLCGNSVPLLMRHIYGVDTVAALVSLALGEPVELAPVPLGAGIIHVLASPLPGEGVLAKVRGVEQVRAMPGVVCCEVYAAPGTRVRPFVQSANKVGYLIVTGPDLASAEARLAATLDVLVLEFEGVSGDAA
jgi:biotin carboxylase